MRVDLGCFKTPLGDAAISLSFRYQAGEGIAANYIAKSAFFEQNGEEILSLSEAVRLRQSLDQAIELAVKDI